MITFIELFAGIGGFRVGLESTNLFKCLYSNDINCKCKKTYDINFTEPKLDVMDINDINIELLPKADMIVGGFPCQSFSIAGKRLGFNDDRGLVFFKMLEIITYIRPKYILLENVKNLITHDNGNTMNTIVNSLININYDISFKLLNTMIYTDVPQNRERVFIFGNLKSLKIDTHSVLSIDQVKELKYVSEYYEEKIDEKYYYNNTHKIFPTLVENISDYSSVYQYRRHYVRKNMKKVCPTLTANMGQGGHNVPIILEKETNKIRKLTPKETLLLQGFPNSYILPELSDTELYKQIGNSVCPIIIYKIAIKLINNL